MWLLPLLPRLARVAAFVYYRIRYRGGPVPRAGAVLLVANHPNSLLDPVLVAAAARRPLRFLAKAPLFADAKVGWLVRAAGAIPTYRRSDDPTLVGRNEEMFRAVEAALTAGDAVALFPEGISHSAPALAPLRTGAARIALGAAGRRGTTFPVVPVGLVLRRREVFRSEAVVLVGPPVSWDDLARRGADDPGAVREFTARLDAALRSLTINLEQWRDAPVVDTAMRVWEAERAVAPDDAERVARQRVTIAILARVRATGDAEGLDLAHDVATHRRRLDRLGLRPHDLVADLGARRAVRWTTARLPLLFPLAAVLASVGWLLFLVPYRITARVIARLQLGVDTVATWKLMLGAVIHALWVVFLAILAWRFDGWRSALAVLVLVPVVGMGGLLVREQWRGSWRDVRRWLLLRSRRSLAATLRQEQRDLARRLDAILTRLRDDAVPE